MLGGKWRASSFVAQVISREYAIRPCLARLLSMSHNPPNAELLDALDAAGFLVMNENRNFGNHSTWYSDWRDMILRDRNHPSGVFIILHCLAPFCSFCLTPFCSLFFSHGQLSGGACAMRSAAPKPPVTRRLPLEWCLSACSRSLTHGQ